MDIPTMAGALATSLFVGSSVPMVWRAYRTRDMDSYSRGHLVLTNLGNALHSLYVATLPPGPIWVLHGMHVLVTAFMLVWHVRHAGRASERSGVGDLRGPDDGEPLEADLDVVGELQAQRLTAPTEIAAVTV